MIQPAWRRAAARSRPPRLLSRKNSGGERDGGTQVVLDVGRWDTEVPRDVCERFPRFPAANDPLYRRGAMNENRLAESAPRIDDHDPVARGRRNELLRPPVL